MTTTTTTPTKIYVPSLRHHQREHRRTFVCSVFGRLVRCRAFIAVVARVSARTRSVSVCVCVRYAGEKVHDLCYIAALRRCRLHADVSMCNDGVASRPEFESPRCRCRCRTNASERTSRRPREFRNLCQSNTPHRTEPIIRPPRREDTGGGISGHSWHLSHSARMATTGDDAITRVLQRVSDQQRYERAVVGLWGIRNGVGVGVGVHTFAYDNSYNSTNARTAAAAALQRS